MKKLFGLLAVFGFFALLVMSRNNYTEDAGPAADVAVADTVLLAPVVVKPVVNFTTQLADARSCVKDFFNANKNVRERSNKNDHPKIDGYFRTIGWKHPEKLSGKAKPWCGAFIGSAWLGCLGEKPYFVKNKSELAQVAKWKKGPKILKKNAGIGDGVTFAVNSHIEAVYDRHPNPTFKFFTACGGNTSAPSGSNDRQGVHIKTRAWQEIGYVISLEKTLKKIS